MIVSVHQEKIICADIALMDSLDNYHKDMTINMFIVILDTI